ncbi:MAG: leucine-rich repeat domain-containing protein [Chitinophagales bacterium]|nr:leucine-rich repeat domain-containing protein [Chitinophagales bacterium]
MKSLFTLAVFLLASNIFAQNVIFDDANFKLTLLNKPCATLLSDPAVQTDVDTNNDGEIQISEATAVATLNLNTQQISNLTGIAAFENLALLDVSANLLTTMDPLLGLNTLASLKTLRCYSNSISVLTLTGAVNLEYLDCSDNELIALNLSEHPKLQVLRCSDNAISSLDFSQNPALTQIDCYENNLQTLQFDNLSELTDLNIAYNEFTAINVAANLKLKRLDLRFNQFGSLSLPKLPELDYLRCDNNKLTFLELDSLPLLRQLWCGANQLSQIDLSTLPNLQFLNCNDNNISELDFRYNYKLTELGAMNNKLVYVNLKNGSNITTALFNGNPDLNNVCCDPAEVNLLKQLLQFAGIFNAALNDYCYIPPGGVSYVVEGQARFDTGNNNCTDGSLASNAIRLQIPAFGNNSGGILLPHEQFKFYLPEGSFNINVQSLAPTLFQASPAQFQVNFPADSSPHQVDICLKPIGIQHDVSISLIPETPFRPGFVSRFKLVYQNKGNQLSEGVITLNFDDNRLDLLQSSVVPDLQNGGTLKWNYSGLRPLESKYIILQLYCNSPADNPAVQIGNLFSFSGGIDGIDPDKTFADNFINLRLETVGAYDPNDKTCLEGERIDPAMVGEFVHYLIRFENTGTYPAEFIVVRDTINTNVFDLNSLEVVATSHPMYTRILQGNRVEFIYENINLPFDDANNDGYVAFRIRTRAGLSIGDKLENRAAIYFDYNLPIITNTAQTVVAPLVDTYAPGDKNTIRLSPNPATNRVYFQSEQAISHVQIHSAEGRLLYSGLLQNNSLSLEGMAQGVYWVRVYTETGNQTLKLIKS